MHVLQIIFPAKTIGVFHISTLRHSHKPWCHKVFSTTVPRGNLKRALVATGPGPALARIVCPAACGAPLGSPTAPPRGWTLGRCWSRYEPRTSWAEEKQPEKGRVLLEKMLKIRENGFDEETWGIYLCNPLYIIFIYIYGECKVQHASMVATSQLKWYRHWK